MFLCIENSKKKTLFLCLWFHRQNFCSIVAEFCTRNSHWVRCSCFLSCQLCYKFSRYHLGDTRLGLFAYQEEEEDHAHNEDEVSLNHVRVMFVAQPQPSPSPAPALNRKCGSIRKWLLWRDHRLLLKFLKCIKIVYCNISYT